jgi:hypothetical protein
MLLPYKSGDVKTIMRLVKNFLQQHDDPGGNQVCRPHSGYQGCEMRVRAFRVSTGYFRTLDFGSRTLIAG